MISISGIPANKKSSPTGELFLLAGAQNASKLAPQARSIAEWGSHSPFVGLQARLQDEERANLRRIGEYLVTQANDINFGWGTGRFEACSASAKREAEWGSHTPPKLPLCHSERAERVELFRPRSQTLLRTI